MDKLIPEKHKVRTVVQFIGHPIEIQIISILTRATTVRER
jgi:hypothetical protein